MTEKEFEREWERGGGKVQAKWGKLTRAERTVVSERRHSHDVKDHELQGISEEEAERANDALEKSRL